MAKGSVKKKRTHEELIQQLILAGYDKQFYLDHVEEYMIYYDNLKLLNDKIKTLETSDDVSLLKMYTELLKEKRQVTKEMRNILSFLKLRPSGDELIAPNGSDEYSKN